MPTADQLLAVVAVINAVGSVIALVIHALRVPYRESAAAEQVAASDSIIRVRQATMRAPHPPSDAAG